MKKTLIIGLLVMAILISGCVSTPTTTPTATMTATPTAVMTTTPATTGSTASVDIKNFMFTPGTLNITSGTTVTWTNDDTVAHTVTSVTGVFDSGSINPGATYSYTFNQTGSFEYGCTIHPSIPHGTVIVT
ncbi:Cupredoxin-like domain protein [uncultured archaeon]|nr:Cupredoxin-like domain protein [uncultured archaeon]